MIEFSITSTQIMGLCSLIAGVWAVIKIIKEIKKPNDDLKATVEHHTKCLHNDDQRLKEIEKTNKLILQCLLVIMDNHMSDSTSDELKETKNQLQEHLINR